MPPPPVAAPTIAVAPPAIVVNGPLPPSDASLAIGLAATEPAGMDALPTLPLPSVAAAGGASAKVAIPEAAPTVPVSGDEGPPTEDSLPPPTPRVGADRMSSKPPKLALGPLQVLLQRVTALRRTAGAMRITTAEQRPMWFLSMVAAAGLLVGIGVVALAMRLTSRRSDEAQEPGVGPAVAASAGHGSKSAEPEGPASTASAPTAVASAAPSAQEQPPAATASVSLAPCTVSGSAKTVAPIALVAAGVEVRSLGDDVALGFAPSDHQAQALRIDAESLAVSSAAAARSKTTIGHVTPALSAKGALRVVIDSDRKSDTLRARRTIPIASSLQVGESAGSLVWAHPGGGPGGTLWPLDGTSEIDAVRASSESSGDDSTTAIALRSAGSIEVGLASGRDALQAKGDLAKFEGLGPAVGAPAIAMNDGVVLVAWADRPSADVPWRLRWVRFKSGEVPSKPSLFTPPGDARGEQAMAPSITAVPGKRFLLVWTEGPATQHEVRAITLSEDGTALGAPLVLSSSGVNAGQGQAAITSAGRGVVAFLESSEDHFKVAAAAITCGM